MKLISDKEIEEAAKEYAIDAFRQIAFIQGALLSEQKLMPLMVEFAKFISNDVVSSRTKGEYKRFYMPNESMTMERMLEQFIEQRNK